MKNIKVWDVNTGGLTKKAKGILIAWLLITLIVASMGMGTYIQSYLAELSNDTVYTNLSLLEKIGGFFVYSYTENYQAGITLIFAILTEISLVLLLVVGVLAVANYPKSKLNRFTNK